MSDDETGTTETTRQLGIRVEKTLYKRLEEEQKKTKKLTGYEPSISDVVRVLIEKGLEANGKRR